MGTAAERRGGEGLRDVLHAGTLVLDGATGTELARRGVPTALPLWSAAALRSHPATVEAIHRDYVDAGADVIVANTFRTNARTLARAGLLDEGAHLNRLAVELARRAVRGALRPAGEAAPHAPLVAASVAPVEDCYRPDLVPDEPTLLDEHRQMMRWVAAAEPDLVWIETMNTVREARAAAQAAREAAVPLAVSFVVREGGELLSGEPLERGVAEVAAFEPLAVGLNCIPPDGMTARLPRLVECVARLRGRHPPAVAAYAHVGNPDPISGWSFSQSVGPAEYAAHALRWRSLGATIIGGCCGTTPEHVRAVAEALRRA